MTATRIFSWARTQPDKSAIIHNDETLSYADFARAIERLKTSFAKYDLPAGGTAVVLFPHLANSWVIVMALRLLGLNTICVYSLAIAEDLNLRDVVCLVRERSGQRNHEIPRKWVGARVISVTSPIHQDNDEGEIASSSPGAPPFGGHMLVTSGTMGTNKKVFLRGDCEKERNAARAQCNLLGHTTVLNNLRYPMWTGAGFKDPSAVWHEGGTVVFDQRDDSTRRIFGYDTTRIFLTPAGLANVVNYFRGMNRAAENENCTLSVSSGLVSLSLIQQAIQHLTKSVMIEWSATELATFPLESMIGSSDDVFWLQPANGRIVEVIDERDEECPPGTEGALRILLTALDSTQYLDDPESSARYFRGGYFYPGDVAVRRADGRIRILGRADDVLNIRGQKFAVGPFEQRVQQLVGSSDVCLFSGLDSGGEEEIVVVIEARDMPSQSLLDRISADLKRKFERVRFEIVGEFPRTETGMQKVRRSALRRMIFKAN